MYIQQIKKQNGHLPVENQTKGTNNLQKHYTGDLQKGFYRGKVQKGDLQKEFYRGKLQKGDLQKGNYISRCKHASGAPGPGADLSCLRQVSVLGP